MEQEESTLVFIVETKNDLEVAKQNLEKYAQEKSVTLTFGGAWKRLNGFAISTSKEDAEKLFNLKVEWHTFVVNNLNKGPYQASDWKIIKEPAVPKELRTEIKSITLDQKSLLTD